MQPIEIFKKYGFDPYALGSRRRDNFTNRLKNRLQEKMVSRIQEVKTVVDHQPKNYL